MAPAREESGANKAPEGIREGSVSTSLQELLRLEEQRQCRVEEETFRRVEMERAEREARERAVRDAEEARTKRAAEEREEQAQRARTEEARLEGVRAAILEQTRLEQTRVAAESKRRADEADEADEEKRRHAHEIELARTRSGNTPRNVALGVLLGTALSATFAAVGYATVLEPQMKRADDAALSAVKERSAMRDQRDKSEHALADERAKGKALHVELAAARANGERLERELDDARHGRPTPAAAIAPTRAKGSASPQAAPERPCLQGDPLCP